MRLITYWDGPATRGGIVVGDTVVPVDVAAGRACVGLAPDARIRDVVGLDRDDLAALQAAAEVAATAGGEGIAPLAGVLLAPPIPDPDKIICVGLNYRDHADETALELPSAPVLFAKFRNSLIGAGEPIALPSSTTAPDYEGELAVVIGRRGKHVAVEDALGLVAGVMPFNDVSARDLQMRTSQWLPGKAIDSFAPCGPWLTTLDEIDDVQDLELVTRLNGEVVQQASTAAMIFPVADTLAFLSSVMTLEPGDIVATGTPAGVGFARKPPLYLRPGDVVEVEITGIGCLSNPVVAAESQLTTEQAAVVS